MLSKRFFTEPGKYLPTTIFDNGTDNFNVFDFIEQESRSVVLTGKDGKIIFEQHDVIVPKFWGDTATTILATKYFRGAMHSPERESSLRQVVDRITSAIETTFIEKKYGTHQQAKILRDELSYMLAHQIMAFNSPVWFNVGVKNVPQQVSACFILDVEDDMESIFKWYAEEGMIFKGGSGAGVNLSKIRSSKELLNGGGTASGPVSFMRGADASAGTIKSGGKTRRAAKMVVLDADHPDIEEFIWCKALEENKIRALRDAGFDVDFDGQDLHSIQYQNANNSVRLTDEFMMAVLRNEVWDLTSRVDGSVIETIDARNLWEQIAEAAWECADPGIQFDSTINKWNTTPNAGRIDASNPCSEHMRLANSSCNLASINLMKFFDRSADNYFDHDAFAEACFFTFIAQNVLIDLADFPTDEIRKVTHRFRDLGLGYANLGALLMSMGLSYDSQEGRATAASITSILTASAYLASAKCAQVHGKYSGYEDAALDIMQKHIHSAEIHNLLYNDTLSNFSETVWSTAASYASKFGLRNAQMTVLAPTGTIGLLMGCDTTGIEPAFDITTYKKLVGGGTITSNIDAVQNAFETLGISTVEEMPHVFLTAAGANSLSPESHVDMMASVQPFLSGAISKTVNLPNSASVKDIANIHLRAWESGIKSIAVYRDGCKAAQPLSGTQNTAHVPATEVQTVSSPAREKMPKQRKGHTRAFRVGELEGYTTTGEYNDGRLGEVFIRVSKQGSTLAGIVDAWSIAVSLGLQHGVPLKSYVEKYAGMRFEPQGMTNDEDVRISASLVDYLFRRLAIDYLDVDSRKELGIFTNEERIGILEDEIKEEFIEVAKEIHVEKIETKQKTSSSPLCYTCGSFMQPSGACHVCATCGTTSGCS